MATRKADLQDGADGESSEKQEVDSAGAALFSMDDLRARLDAPLFHRDQGLAAPAQLPRLRELTLDHVVEEPVVANAVVESPVEPVVAAPAPEPEPTPPAHTPRATLVSFSDMLASALQKDAEAEATPEPEPERQPEEDAGTAPTLGPVETQALLSVLKTFETSANKIHDLRIRAGEVAMPAAPVVQEVPVVQEAPVVQEVPVVQEAPAVPEVVQAIPETPVAAVAKIEQPVREISAPVPVIEAPVAGDPAVNGRSSIEAELNRLAFLPDQEEPVGRVVVPVIAHTEQRESLGVPVLSQHEMYNPRSIPIQAGKRNMFEAAFEATTTTRRRSKKSGFRRLFSLVIVLAIVGGGLYAAKYYLLDPKWTPEVKELVKEVEAARGLEFDHAVDVTSLSADEYATRIARHALGVNGSNEDQVAGELRALGLLTGALDLRAIGLAALPETPAYYDAGAEEIFVVSGLPDATYRFAMYRALAAAMLDQKYGWGGRVHGASPAVVHGTTALYEADALATASSMLTAEDRTLVLTERPGLFTTFSVLATPSQFGTAVAGHLGLALRGFIEATPLVDRDAVLNDATIADEKALDLRRLVAGVADGTVSQPGAKAEGMLFWYHVLASRLDPASAWNSALAIEFDDVLVSVGPSGYCVAAILTVTPSAFDGVNAAFATWAATAPLESTTTAIGSNASGNPIVTVNACDPGIAVPTNNGVAPLSMGGAPLRAEQYRLLMAAQPALPRAQAACAVYSGDTVTIADERLIVDPPEGYLAPNAHPAADPNRADCVPV